MLSPQLRDNRIEISIGPTGLRRTYCCEGIRTATVYLMAGRWWVRRYLGPDDADSVRQECGTPASGEAIAIRHTLRLVEPMPRAHTLSDRSADEAAQQQQHQQRP